MTERKGLVVAFAVGTLCVAYGGWLLLTSRRLADVPAALWWLAGVLVAHDGIVAPLTIIAGLLVVRFIPALVRPPVQAGLFVSVVLVVASSALVLGLGRDPLNPSLLPLPYGRNLALLLGLVWAAVLAAIVVRSARSRRRPRDEANPSRGPQRWR
ncbi:MAG: hypothetical protein GEV10_02430 [Streptosporangiales bacterium]|nr:hypothetical protein [Streptosporangiales bacterium]